MARLHRCQAKSQLSSTLLPTAFLLHASLSNDIGKLREMEALLVALGGEVQDLQSGEFEGIGGDAEREDLEEKERKWEGSFARFFTSPSLGPPHLHLLNSVITCYPSCRCSSSPHLLFHQRDLTRLCDPHSSRLPLLDLQPQLGRQLLYLKYIRPYSRSRSSYLKNRSVRSVSSSLLQRRVLTHPSHPPFNQLRPTPTPPLSPHPIHADISPPTPHSSSSRRQI